MANWGYPAMPTMQAKPSLPVSMPEEWQKANETLQAVQQPKNAEVSTATTLTNTKAVEQQNGTVNDYTNFSCLQQPTMYPAYPGYTGYPESYDYSNYNFGNLMNNPPYYINPITPSTPLTSSLPSVPPSEEKLDTTKEEVHSENISVSSPLQPPPPPPALLLQVYSLSSKNLGYPMNNPPYYINPITPSTPLTSSLPSVPPSEEKLATTKEEVYSENISVSSLIQPPPIPPATPPAREITYFTNITSDKSFHLREENMVTPDLKFIEAPNRGGIKFNLPKKNAKAFDQTIRAAPQERLNYFRRNNLTPQKETNPVNQGNQNVAVQKSVSSVAECDYPESLKNYVSKSFEICKTNIDKDQVELILRKKLHSCNAEGTLRTKDWDAEPLPRYTGYLESYDYSNYNLGYPMNNPPYYINPITPSTPLTSSLPSVPPSEEKLATTKEEVHSENISVSSLIQPPPIPPATPPAREITYFTNITSDKSFHLREENMVTPDLKFIESPNWGGIKFNLPKKNAKASYQTIRAALQERLNYFRSNNLTPQKETNPVNQGNQNVAVQKSGSSVAEGDWPESLKNYVSKSFEICKTNIDKDQVELILRKKLHSCNAEGTLRSKDWDAEPLPRFEIKMEH